MAFADVRHSRDDGVGPAVGDALVASMFPARALCARRGGRRAGPARTVVAVVDADARLRADDFGRGGGERERAGSRGRNGRETVFVGGGLRAFVAERRARLRRGHAGGVVALDDHRHGFADVRAGRRFDGERGTFFGRFRAGKEQQFVAGLHFGFTHSLRRFAVAEPEVPKRAAEEGVGLAEDVFDGVSEAAEPRAAPVPSGRELERADGVRSGAGIFGFAVLDDGCGGGRDGGGRKERLRGALDADGDASGRGGMRERDGQKNKHRAAQGTDSTELHEPPLSTRALWACGRRQVSWLPGLPLRAFPTAGGESVARARTRRGGHPRSQWRVRAGFAPASLHR